MPIERLGCTAQRHMAGNKGCEYIDRQILTASTCRSQNISMRHTFGRLRPRHASSATYAPL